MQTQREYLLARKAQLEGNLCNADLRPAVAIAIYQWIMDVNYQLSHLK
jgi:hypothetical protein